MNTSTRTEKIRDLFEEIARELITGPNAAAVRTPAHEKSERGELATPFAFAGADVHPIFPLLHHFRSEDSYVEGYTANPHRGDHLSVPVVFDGAWGVLETSFHKGNTYVEFVTPAFEPESPLYRAALQLLEAEETR